MFPVGVLRPGRFGMQRGNSGLQLVGATAVMGQGNIEQGQPLLNADLVPGRAILLFQWHQLPFRSHAGGAARVVQQGERQQGQHLGFLRHQLDQQPRQTDRLGAQIQPDQP